MFESAKWITCNVESCRKLKHEPVPCIAKTFEIDTLPKSAILNVAGEYPAGSYTFKKTIIMNHSHTQART